MLTRLRPLRLDAVKDKPAYLPAESQLHNDLQKAGVDRPLLGYAKDLKALESGVRNKAQTRKSLLTEGGVPALDRYSVFGRTGSTANSIGGLFDALHRARSNLQGVLKGKSEKRRDELTNKHALANILDETALQSTKGEKSGAKWYEDAANVSNALIHIIDNDPKLRRWRGFFGEVDPRTHKADASNANLQLFKALLAPTSAGTNPATNVDTAWRIFEHALSATPRGESPFSHLPTRNPATGNQWPGKVAPSQINKINYLVESRGPEGAVEFLNNVHHWQRLADEFGNALAAPAGKDADYMGSHVFGPKIGPYYQGISQRADQNVKDKWFTRAWRRYTGRILKNGEVDEDLTDKERANMDATVGEASKITGIPSHVIQAIMWYYEKDLWEALGALGVPRTFREGIAPIMRKKGLDIRDVKFPPSQTMQRIGGKLADAAQRSRQRHSRKSRLKPLRMAAAPAALPTATTAAGLTSLQQPAAPPIDKEQQAADKHREQMLAFSPNVDDLSFDEALARSRSGNHKAFKDIVKRINEQVGLGKTKIEGAVGDWQDGAENSLLQSIKEPVDQDTLKYLSAWYGLLANQKSVLAFNPQFNGPDSAYTIDVPSTDLAAVRKSLTGADINFRTLVPTKKGTKVFIFDPHRENRDKVARWAGEFGGDIHESTGQGFFIGDSSDRPNRTKARSEYRKIITAYEEAAAKSGGKVRTYQPPAEPHHIRTGDGKPARQSKKGRPVKLSGVQSPAGGVVVRGVFYPGGRYIPSANLEKASYPQYREVEEKRIKRAEQAGRYRRSDGSYDTNAALYELKGIRNGDKKPLYSPR